MEPTSHIFCSTIFLVCFDFYQGGISYKKIQRQLYHILNSELPNQPKYLAFQMTNRKEKRQNWSIILKVKNLEDRNLLEKKLQEISGGHYLRIQKERMDYFHLSYERYVEAFIFHAFEKNYQMFGTLSLNHLLSSSIDPFFHTLWDRLPLEKNISKRKKKNILSFSYKDIEIFRNSKNYYSIFEVNYSKFDDKFPHQLRKLIEKTRPYAGKSLKFTLCSENSDFIREIFYLKADYHEDLIEINKIRLNFKMKSSPYCNGRLSIKLYKPIIALHPSFLELLFNTCTYMEGNLKLQEILTRSSYYKYNNNYIPN